MPRMLEGKWDSGILLCLDKQLIYLKAYLKLDIKLDIDI